MFRSLRQHKRIFCNVQQKTQDNFRLNAAQIIGPCSTQNIARNISGELQAQSKIPKTVSMEKFPVDIPWQFVDDKKDMTSLIWDLIFTDSNKYHAKVYLRTSDANDDDNSESESGKNSLEKGKSSTEENVKNSKANANAQKSQHDSSLPPELEASVLQYQRQKRKTDAAKRAGTAITNDQLDIVYEDDSIVVVNKPAGVLCVPGIHNNPSIANLVFERLSKSSSDREDIDDQQCPDACSMTVHRLDMDTSGLVVFGKTKTVVTKLHEVFRRESDQGKNKRNRKRGGPKQIQTSVNSTNDTTLQGKQQESGAVVKEYEALVCGHFPNNVETGIIDLPLQRDIHHPPFMRVSTPHSETLARQVVDALRERNWTKLSKRNPKPSQTIFRVMSREYYYDGGGNTRGIPVTRLSLTPVTGRTHQLRVHCAALGFPIVGDAAYGIYGEAAFCAGLYHNIVQVMTMNSGNGDQYESFKGKQTLSAEDEYWRAPIALQKESMEVYPPGERDMCLHAKVLGFPHPITGEEMKWKANPTF